MTVVVPSDPTEVNVVTESTRVVVEVETVTSVDVDTVVGLVVGEASAAERPLLSLCVGPVDVVVDTAHVVGDDRGVVETLEWCVETQTGRGVQAATEMGGGNWDEDVARGTVVRIGVAGTGKVTAGDGEG